jgi:hypothetical protein
MSKASDLNDYISDILNNPPVECIPKKTEVIPGRRGPGRPRKDGRILSEEERKELGLKPKKPKTWEEEKQQFFKQEEHKAKVFLLRRLPRILNTLTEKAVEGDMQAIKIIIDRLIPIRKAVDKPDSTGVGGIKIVVSGVSSIETEPSLDGDYEEVTYEEG